MSGSGGVVNADRNAAAEMKLTEREGRFYWRGEHVKIRHSDSGVSIGCTKISWETWDQLKLAIEAGR